MHFLADKSVKIHSNLARDYEKKEKKRKETLSNKVECTCMSTLKNLFLTMISYNVTVPPKFNYGCSIFFIYFFNIELNCLNTVTSTESNFY